MTDVLHTPAPKLSSDRVGELLDALWGYSARGLSPLASERDLNVRVDDSFVLKVSNAAEDASIIDMEINATEHLRRVDPTITVPRTIPGRNGAVVLEVHDDGGRSCAARLISLLPGEAMEGTPITGRLAEQIGSYCARTSLALSGFFHPAAGRRLDWDVRRVGEVLSDDDGVLEVMGETGARLRQLAPRLSAAGTASRSLRGGVQHADVTLTNLLADTDGVSGLIDFGDMHFTADVCDLAVCLASVLRNTFGLRDSDHLWDLTANVLNGYQRHRPLESAEVDILGELVMARLWLTLAISGRRARAYPDNAEYIAQHDTTSRTVLAELAALEPDELAQRFATLTGIRKAHQTGSTPSLLDRRHSAMGGRLTPLFYSEPLEFVRGEGPWLYDDAGEPYLDAYNNVAVVGHAHPTVTQAVSRQLATINTHSRYLHPNIVELAERLTATMPDELDTCIFTTSGTEANDLAWRIATASTGGTAAVVADHAYHGSSRWLADLSPNEWPKGHRPDHVATFISPASGDGSLSHGDGAERMDDALHQLQRCDEKPALVLADIGFTSAGIHDTPADFIHGLVDGAHSAGALFLADEVQSGYGRSGRMWRFQHAGVTPDFVTLGKPMGAGYPIGAVITRRELADALAEHYEYFSTFAATPAAAAAGLAVLDVLDTEHLVTRAATTGDHLRQRLTDLESRTHTIGAVRGRGLIAGVDLVAPTGDDHRGFARRVLDGLARRRVLAGLTGPSSTVLKIRPPLVWTTDHADRFVDTLAEVVSSVS